MATENIVRRFETLIDDFRRRVQAGLNQRVVDRLAFQCDQLRVQLIRLTGLPGWEYVDEALLLVQEAVQLLQSWERQNTDETVQYQAPVCHTGQRGRPSFRIPDDHLQYLFCHGFGASAIDNMLGVSLRTVRRDERSRAILEDEILRYIK